ncbi:MAG: hypothetical protein V3V14_02735 [Saprospiraceae bacterium]
MIEHSEKYWSDLVEKYKNGNISQEDRFILEKRALDDSFLFDALEGYALYNNEKQTKVTKQKIFTIGRILAAASVLGFVILAMFMKNNTSSVVSDNREYATVITNEEKESANDIITENAQDDQDKAIKRKTKKIISKVQKEKLTVVANKKKTKQQSPQKENKARKENTINSSQKDNIQSRPPSNEDVSSEIIENQKTSSESTDIEDMAIEKNQKKSEIIVTTSKSSNVNQSTTVLDGVSLESDNISPAQDIEDTQFTEETILESPIQSIMPKIGKKIFDDYVSTKISERGLNQNPEQVVIIQFSTGKDGRLTNFKQLTNNCPKCAAFAISLLQQSGEWIIKNPSDRIGTYSFNF